MDPPTEELSVDHIGFSKSNEFTPLNPEKTNDNGFKVIVGCFTILTVVVSVALMVHIFQGENAFEAGTLGGLVADNKECVSIGENLLREGGNAVDVAVGVVFCMGVVHPHLTGIGGYGLMLIYDHKLGNLRDCINFNGKGTNSKIIGIPGLINGLSFAHRNYGKLRWKKILSYSVELARTGFTVTESLKSSAMHLKPENIKTELGQWLNSLKVGTVTKSESLAKTLESLAEQGGNAFYDEILIKNVAHFLSADDMKNYKVLNNICAVEEWNKFKLFTTGQGTGGPLLLKALKNVNNNVSIPFALIKSINEALTTAENYTYGVVVTSMDKDDNYVSVVTGLGSVLGSQILMPGGFILNDAVKYGTRITNELDTLSLSLVITEAQVCSSRYVTGASDFRDLLQTLLMLEENHDLQTVVENPRMRMLDNTIFLELDHAPSFSSDEINQLPKAGFRLVPAAKPYPSINVIHKLRDKLYPYADSRGLGLGVTV